GHHRGARRFAAGSIPAELVGRECPSRAAGIGPSVAGRLLGRRRGRRWHAPRRRFLGLQPVRRLPGPQTRLAGDDGAKVTAVVIVELFDTSQANRKSGALIVAMNPRQSKYPLDDASGEWDAMFYRFFRKLRRSARHWNTDLT